MAKKSLHELIDELCPDGVEYKTLSELCEIGTGSHNTQDAVDDGVYPFYVRSPYPLLLNEYDFDDSSVITAGDGVGVGKVFHITNGKYALHQRAYRIRSNDDQILNIKYLYYCFTSMFYNYIMLEKVDGSVASIRLPMLKNFEIPVPPLPVQEEIVRILDKFTEITIELQENLVNELSARKQQYEYYRDELLTFGNDIMKPVKDVARIVGGKDYKHLNEGNIPVYGSGGVMCYVDKSAYNKPSVLLPRKGSIANVFYVDKPFWNVDTIFYTEIDEKVIIPKYFYYAMVNAHIEDYNTSNAARPALTRTVLDEIMIPVPTIVEQERIVALLDRFDALCNDITAGLPAEIEARQQQYEHYRDLLLTFKRKDVAV